MNIRSSPVVLLMLLLLFGCAGNKTKIDGRQFVLVPDPDSPKTVTLILAGYLSCAGSVEACETLEAQQKTLQKNFETCVARGMRRTGRKVSLVGHDDAALYPSLDPLINQFAAVGEISGEDIQHQLANTSLDYVVSIRAKTYTGNKELTGFIDSDSGSGAFIWGMGQAWEKTSMLEARIYSVESGLLAGELSAKLTDEAFWMQTAFVIFPLIPVGWSPDVENTSCTEMGEALGRFFSGAGNNYLE